MPKKTITLDDLYEGQQVLGATVADLYQGQQALVATVFELQKGQLTLAKKIDSFGEELSELRVYTEAGFDTMNGRFDRLEDQVDRLGSNGINPGYHYER